MTVVGLVGEECLERGDYVGVLYSGVSEYRGTQHSSEWFGGSIQKPPLFFAWSASRLLGSPTCKG